MSLILAVVITIILFLLLIPLFFFFFTLALVLSLLLLVSFLVYLVVDYFTAQEPAREPLLPLLPPSEETPLLPLLPPLGNNIKEYRLSAPVVVSGNTNLPIPEFSNLTIDEEGTWSLLFAFYVNATLVEKRLDIDVYVDDTLHSSYAVDFNAFMNFTTLTGGFTERFARGSVISFRARAIRFSGAIILPEGTYINLVQISNV